MNGRHIGIIVGNTLVILVSLILVSHMLGQESPQTLKIPPPDRESFAESSDLAIPWRDSFRVCWSGARYKLPNCHIVSFAEFDARAVLTIYNADSSVWFQFNVQQESPNFPSKKDFIPLAPKGSYLTNSVILRMTGESANWYRVEVNEETQATKYISKSDPNWAKITWSLMFNWSNNVYLDESRTRLRSKPNGEVIQEYAGIPFSYITYEKLDGDWMYVKGCQTVQPPYGCYYGWVRWREGRKILVGSLLNGRKIPDISVKEEKLPKAPH